MLLTSDVLIIDQVSSMMRSDFVIYDHEGTEVGEIKTMGSTASRMVMGHREFNVYDGDKLSFEVVDVHNIFRDRYEVREASGALLADIAKRLTFFRLNLEVRLADDARLGIQGNLKGNHYDVKLGDSTVATVRKSWPGIKEAFLSHARFVVVFDPNVSPQHRQAILGCAIAIDRIRAKDSASTAAGVATT